MRTDDFIKEQKNRIDQGGKLKKGEKRCASVFATNDRIYSYGYHYPLLFQVVTPNNSILWVCNNGGYSNTTAKHIAYGACLADVLAPMGGINDNIVDYGSVLKSIEGKKEFYRLAMEKKKRKDTAVYRVLEHSFLKASADLTLLLN